MLTQTSRYEYSPIAQRKPLKFPDGKRVAVTVYINIEHFPDGAPGVAIYPPTVSLKPDVLNYGWRDYGNRVGIWRIFDIMAKHGVRGTVCLNADVCREYPQIVEAGNGYDWEWMGHGINNTQMITGIEEDEERSIIKDCVDGLTKTTGKAPRGWLAPALTETYNSPDLLAEAGIEYLCDFTCDDQPFPLKVRSGSLISMPYSVELNDLPAYLAIGVTGGDFGTMIKDQFDVLYEEGKTNGRVIPICIHTFLTGQAFRAKHFDEALKYITSHDDVWLTTGGEINDWYRENYL